MKPRDWSLIFRVMIRIYLFDMKLRNYQKELIQGLRHRMKQGKRRLIAQLATGGGKTFTFCAIIKSAISRGARVLVLTDRKELLTQAGGALDNFGLLPDFIEAGEYPDLSQPLFVAMVETLYRRIDQLEYIRFMESLDVVVIDEAHMRNFTKLFPYFPDNAVVLGFTATPSRNGRKQLLHEEYQDIVEGVSIQYMVQNGYLAKPHYYGVEVDLSGVKQSRGDYDKGQMSQMYSETKLYTGVLENYKRLTDGKKAIVFSSTVANSKEVCQEFIQNGYDAKHFDSNMTDLERDEIKEWFDRSPNGILCNVDIFTKGFDQPDIEVVILYRATKSLTLFLQMVGRGSRTTPGKTDFTVLDFGNNIQEHGFWHQERKWILKPPPKRKRKEDDIASIKNCPECGAMIAVSLRKCTECGYEFPVNEKEKEMAVLKELKYSDIKRELKEGVSFERLEAIREAKDYRQGWAWRQVKDEDLAEYAAWKGYSTGWVHFQLKQREKNKQ